MSTAFKYDGENASTLAEEVMARSSQNLMACYQCRKCAAGCPVAEATGVAPDQLICKFAVIFQEVKNQGRLGWEMARKHRMHYGLERVKGNRELERLYKKAKEKISRQGEEHTR